MSLPPAIQAKTTPGPAPNGLGRGLFASTDLRTEDDVLHIQTPFVAVLDTERLTDTCSGCFGKRQLESQHENETVLKACTGCRVVWYCDKTCQAKDWKLAHSHECAIFRNLYPRILPNNARAVLRVILRTTKGKKHPYTPQEIELFNQLETHIREIRDENPGQWERIYLSSKAVKAYSGTDIEEEIISAFGARLDINAFNLTNALYDRLGLYLHPYAALINHSCEYNSVVGFDGPDLYVKAIRPIRKGEQIFISYVDATNATRIRKKELRERYFFDCCCERCSSEDGSSSPSQTRGSSAVIAAQNAYAMLQRGSGSANTRQLQDAIRTLNSDSWPITKQPLVSLRDELIASLISSGKFKAAFVHAAIRYLDIDPVVYPRDAHPMRAVHAWTLVKLAIHLSQVQAYPEPNHTLLGDGAGEDVVGLDGVNFGLIIWSVLSGLVASREGCTVPGFRGLVGRAFEEVHGEFRARGLDPRELGEVIREEWEKVRRAVSVLLRVA